MSDEHVNTPARELFAAANSGKGFCSFYGEIFSPERTEHRYLIKGGPGTGKSSLMKRVASEAESRGYGVEYYKCSSDHTSLDAILIDGRVALIDSTAPHAIEPEIVGAHDEIVDLGVFWSSEMLRAQKERIEELSKEKSARYRAAYRYLEAAEALDAHSRETVAPYVKREKLRRAAERLVATLPTGDGYRYRTGICSSIGMKGRQRLDFYESAAEKIYAVRDAMSVGTLFLAAIADAAVEKRASIVVSYDPIDLASPDAILFEDSRVAFILCSSQDEEHFGDKLAGSVNAKRFLSHDISGEKGRRAKAEYRFDRREREAMIDSACEQLSLAGKAHFSLEKIYGESMDFDALERFTKSLAVAICDSL